MKRIFYAVFLLIGFSCSAFSQTSETKIEEIEINICQPSWTEAARQSSFHATYIYRAVTNEKGFVKEIKEVINDKRFRYLLNDEKVEPCIKKWKLKPSEKYIITISVGTTGDQYLFISSKKDKIRINL